MELNSVLQGKQTNKFFSKVNPILNQHPNTSFLWCFFQNYLFSSSSSSLFRYALITSGTEMDVQNLTIDS